MTDIDGWERIRLQMVGGRVSNERSYAQERRFYGDPANNVRFQGEELMQGTKEIENILRNELENWLRWARRRDWKPTSFRCPLGFLYKSTDYADEPRIVCDDISAAEFERIIVSLPERHRQAFVMHHLGRAADRGRVRILKGREEGAKLLCVQVRQYHYLVNQAHQMVLRKAKSIG